MTRCQISWQIFSTCLVLISSLSSPSLADEPSSSHEPASDGPSLSGRRQSSSPLNSILSLLGTMSSSSDLSAVKDHELDCPGQCLHVVAALLCTKVDRSRSCHQSSHRCCIQVQERKSDVKKVTPNETTTIKTTTTTEKVKKIPKTTTTTTTTSTTTTTTTTTTKRPVILKSRLPLVGAQKRDDSGSCPGVCVSKRLASFCEAVLAIDGMCHGSLQCCVSRQLFGTRSPPELIVPGKSGLIDLEVTTTTTTRKPTTTTTTTTTSTTTQPPTTKRSASKKPKRNKSGSTEDYEAESAACSGTCVSGLLKMLCPTIDTKGKCEKRGSKCCVSSRNKKKVGPKTRGTQKKRSSSCKGRCVPEHMASVCSKVLEKSTCKSKGSVCCDVPETGKKEKNVKKKNQSTNSAANVLSSMLGGSSDGQPSAASALLPLLGPALGSILGGGGKGSNANPMSSLLSSVLTKSSPPRRVAPRRPIAPQIDDKYLDYDLGGLDIQVGVEDSRPVCPGACIPPVLSFTCFSRAQLSDMFKCSDDAKKCCSPKTAIIEREQALNRRLDIAANASAGKSATKSRAELFYQQFPGGSMQPLSHARPNHDQTRHLPVAKNQLQQRTINVNRDLQPHQQMLQQAVPHVGGPKRHLSQPAPPFPPQLGPLGFRSKAIENTAQITTTQTKSPVPESEKVKVGTIVEVASYQSQDANKLVCGIKGDVRTALKSGLPRPASVMDRPLIRRRQGRVVGGEDSLPGEWCWQVALINAKNQYFCGGALIHTKWALTAAHCVTNIVRGGGSTYVRVGDHDLTQRLGSPGAQTMRVATTYIHHNHNSETLDNDIALLRLDGGVELKNGVCMVCLPARGSVHQPGKRCVVTGYGFMKEEGPIPLMVREAPVPMMEENECVRKINTVTQDIYILPESAFCAGGELGNDACEGDGGGPLVCENRGYYELTGLVSWGFGCGRQDVPGVYTKISDFIGWINQIISVNDS